MSHSISRTIVFALLSVVGCGESLKPPAGGIAASVPDSSVHEAAQLDCAGHGEVTQAFIRLPAGAGQGPANAGVFLMNQNSSDYLVIDRYCHYAVVAGDEPDLFEGTLAASQAARLSEDIGLGMWPLASQSLPADSAPVPPFIVRWKGLDYAIADFHSTIETRSAAVRTLLGWLKDLREQGTRSRGGGRIAAVRPAPVELDSSYLRAAVPWGGERRLVAAPDPASAAPGDLTVAVMPSDADLLRALRADARAGRFGLPARRSLPLRQGEEVFEVYFRESSWAEDESGFIAP